ncbi:hypothetical protein GFK82_00038 [Candidatus Steffania adelgidicola]|nr:hypothetical protein GFK82_00038 [Candidatus Steffania adelgidicola]
MHRHPQSLVKQYVELLQYRILLGIPKGRGILPSNKLICYNNNLMHMSLFLMST